MPPMTSAPVAALIVVLTLAAVLTVSGLAKLRDPRATEDAFVALRVPRLIPRRLAARALPWAELVAAALLLVTPAGWLVPVAIGVLLLMLAYTLLIGRALTFEEPVACSCFGSLGRHEVDPLTLARNLMLSFLTVVVVWLANDGGSVPALVGDLDAAGWWAILAAVAAALVIGLVVGGPSATNDRVDPSTGGQMLDYQRQAIPYGVLTVAGGQTLTLRDLVRAQACLLVVLDPNCGPCVRTAEKLDEWAVALAPAVGIRAVYPEWAGDLTDPGHSTDLIAIEPEANVRHVFSVGTPAAVLLGADLMLAGGPVAGERKVAAFVDDILAELAVPAAMSDVDP